jgi:hypothetical protein
MTLYQRLQYLDGEEMITAARTLTPEQERVMKEIELEQRQAAAQELIDEYAGKSETVRQAILGQSSIYDLAKPIVERCKELEKQYEGKRGDISAKAIFWEKIREMNMNELLN